MTREINDAGLELIKSFESCSLTPYLDVGGVPTIGYGHTEGVSMDGAPIEQEQADSWLLDDLDGAEHVVENTINVPINDNQYAALVSLVFNCGGSPLTGTLGTKLNSGDVTGASEEFSRWNHVHGVICDGLTKRRAAEQGLFNTPMES